MNILKGGKMFQAMLKAEGSLHWGYEMFTALGGEHTNCFACLLYLSKSAEIGTDTRGGSATCQSHLVHGQEGVFPFGV